MKMNENEANDMANLHVTKKMFVRCGSRGRNQLGSLDVLEQLQGLFPASSFAAALQDAVVAQQVGGDINGTKSQQDAECT